MRKMKDYPSVLRTEYLYEALCRRDAAAAEKIKARFDAVAARYPYPCEIRGERELMDAALHSGSGGE